MSHEFPPVARDISLEEYGAEVLRTGRRCHLVLTDDHLVGMMNVHTLNAVPRDEWPHMSVQAVMIPREKILWASPDEPLLGLLERLLASDVNQIQRPLRRGEGNGRCGGGPPPKRKKRQRAGASSTNRLPSAGAKIPGATRTSADGGVPPTEKEKPHILCESCARRSRRLQSP